MMNALRIALVIALLGSFCAGQQFMSSLPQPSDLFNSGMNSLSGATLNQNPTDALNKIRASADSGYAPALTVMGYFYETGTYVVKNPSHAAAWYRKAAESGDSLGEWALGRMYFTGTGVQRDLAEAQKWLRRSASHGNPYAQYTLGAVLQDRDYTASPDWLRDAAEQGIPQAQQMLARLLIEGRGVSINKYEAYVWLLLCSDAGIPVDQSTFGGLEAELGSEKVSQAKIRARELARTATRSVNAKGCTGWRGELEQVPTIPPPEIQLLCR